MIEGSVKAAAAAGGTATEAQRVMASGLAHYGNAGSLYRGTVGAVGTRPRASRSVRRTSLLPQSQTALFGLVIKCANAAEPEVSGATFAFWQRLYDELGHMYG